MLQFLTEPEIAAAAATGAVRFGDVEPGPPVDVAEAVRSALLAFGDGLYKVMVDRQDIESLDDDVPVSDDTDLLFVRLVALAGG